MGLVIPVRRRRSHPNDPLTKMTLQLSQSVVESIRAAVANGDAASANAFVEDAVREKLREKRREKVYAEYEQAANDPDYMRDLNADLSAFDATLSDDTG